MKLIMARPGSVEDSGKFMFGVGKDGFHSVPLVSLAHRKGNTGATAAEVRWLIRRPLVG